MTSWLSRLVGWARAAPRLSCNRALWHTGVEELRRRTHNGRRESGAFLLGNDNGATRQIQRFVFYDDVDPHALDSGIVHFNGNKFGRLWEICRTHDQSVVADVHVHPGGYQQSVSDQSDPVIPRAGHLALILPDFAARATDPGGIGMYEYLGNKRWKIHTHRGERFFRLEP